MSVQQANGPHRPATVSLNKYMPPVFTEFGRVQDLTSQASAGAGGAKFGNGQEGSKSWQIRT